MRTITGRVTDFYRGETSEITVLCKKEGVAENITADTVTLIIKSEKSDADTSAVLEKDADVSSYGASGIAYFDLAPADTDISPGSYYIDITWYDGTDEHIVYDGRVTVKERVSDV